LVEIFFVFIFASFLCESKNKLKYLLINYNLETSNPEAVILAKIFFLGIFSTSSRKWMVPIIYHAFFLKGQDKENTTRFPLFPPENGL
jgi:hypothetical protein